MPAVAHQALEPVVGVLDDGLDGGARLGACRLIAAGRGLERRGFDVLDLHADRLQELGHIGILEDDADRADDGALLRQMWSDAIAAI